MQYNGQHTNAKQSRPAPYGLLASIRAPPMSSGADAIVIFNEDGV